jgi:hypothetical protein
MTVELYFEMFEKLELGFDQNGAPIWPTPAGGMAHQLREMEQLIANTPSLYKRLTEVVLEKRRKWNAREADRTLVG